MKMSVSFDYEILFIFRIEIMSSIITIMFVSNHLMTHAGHHVKL